MLLPCLVWREPIEMNKQQTWDGLEMTIPLPSKVKVLKPTLGAHEREEEKSPKPLVPPHPKLFVSIYNIALST